MQSCLTPPQSVIPAFAHPSSFHLHHRHRFSQPFRVPLFLQLQQWPFRRCPPVVASSDYPAQLGNSDIPSQDDVRQMARAASAREKAVESRSFWSKLQTNSGELRARIAKLGLAAVLAYGLFDGITYTTFFVLAFLGYEKSTGNNPAANIQALLGIVILMWTGNNVTRPFRVAGAAAVAPFMDKALRRIQEALKLPNQFTAFILVAVSFASVCLSIAGLLILSRLAK